jgi:hypothetical protein
MSTILGLKTSATIASLTYCFSGLFLSKLSSQLNCIANTLQWRLDRSSHIYDIREWK